MNDTEQLPTAAEKTARTNPRWEKYPLQAPPTAEGVACAEAALGFALPPLLTALYTRIADGGFGREYGPMPLIGDRAPDGEESFEPNADEPQHAWYVDQPDLAQRLRSWLDGTAWYSEESEDEGADLAPWPDFSARVRPMDGQVWRTRGPRTATARPAGTSWIPRPSDG
ncbi:SMI1/KNR4 family protein [Streptomyces sp. NPDC057557]|uniref:SMI1/KNR4 family protein n=1 Tax=Streptomyces sp. NPDC057557 TaxID=3346167 RepID=UPI003682624E